MWEGRSDEEYIEGRILEPQNQEINQGTKEGPNRFVQPLARFIQELLVQR